MSTGMPVAAVNRAGRRVVCPSCGQLRPCGTDGEIYTHPIPGPEPRRPRCRGNTPVMEHRWLYTLVVAHSMGRWDESLIDSVGEVDQ